MKTTLHISTDAILISWDDEQLNDLIHNMFTPWQAEECSPTYEVTINRTENGHILTTPYFSVSCHDKKTLSSYLEYNLTLLSQKILETSMQIHASCVDINSNGALLVGSHGSGKTTLALTAISSGQKALTDDIAVLSENFQHVIGFPRPFKVTDRTWNLHPRLIPEDSPYLRISQDTTYVFFYIPSGRYYVDKTRLKHIIFIMRRNGPSTIRELGETEAVRKILPQGFKFYKKKDGSVKDLLSLFRRVSPLEITYSDPWDAFNKICEVIG